MNGLMTANKAYEFYKRHTTKRYSKASGLMTAMFQATGQDGRFAWIDATTNRYVTDGVNILAFIDYQERRGTNRNQRATVNSSNAAPGFNYPIGKAAKRKENAPKRTAPKGEERVNANGVTYTYLSLSNQTDEIRRF